MRFATTIKVGTRALEVRARGVLGLRLRPYKALLELTSSCNSRCTTCGIWKNPASVKKHDLNLPEIESFLGGFGKDLVWLALSGGEVTLVEHFPAVIGAAKKLCPNLRVVTFTTNGLLPEKALAYASCIRDAGIDCFITVSLDGDPETHDRIRGVPGNHALAVRTLELLRSAGIQAHFGITLGDGNQEFIEKRFHEHASDIKAVSFVESHGMYRQKNRVDDAGISRSLKVILASYRITSPGDLIEWLYLRLAAVFYGSGRRVLPVRCDVLRSSVHVRPNGDVHPCMFLPSIGNVRLEGFQEIRDGEASRAALRRVDATDCPRCWMNCYAPHSILSRPLTSLFQARVSS